jgi:hypothetical protein
LSDVQRRGGGTGGVLKGAVTGGSLAGTVAPFTGPAAPFVLAGGAIAGAIKGAVSKHAASAPRDVDVATASNVLTSVIQNELGRQPNPGEIQQLLAGQGLKPGDRWVGEGGLMSVIAALKSQGGGSMQPSYVAHG